MNYNNLSKEELIEYCKNDENRINVYIPVASGHELILDADLRRHENQYESRLKHFDIGGKSVIDIGCNTGYISNWCAINGATSVIGLDNDQSILNVCNSAKNLSDIPNLKYVYADKYQYFRDNQEVFDVALQLSNFENERVISELQEYGHIAKVWYVEPTNRPWPGEPRGYDREYLQNWGNTELTQFGHVEFLGTTDYQDRGLFKITMK